MSNVGFSIITSPRDLGGKISKQRFVKMGIIAGTLGPGLSQSRSRSMGGILLL